MTEDEYYNPLKRRVRFDWELPPMKYQRTMPFVEYGVLYDRLPDAVLRQIFGTRLAIYMQRVYRGFRVRWGRLVRTVFQLSADRGGGDPVSVWAIDLT